MNTHVISTDDRLQVHRDAGKPDVVRARHDRVKRSAQAVPVDHHIQRQEDGAQAVREELKNACRKCECRRAERLQQLIVMYVAHRLCEGRGQMRAGKKCHETSPQRRLLINEIRRLGKKFRDCQGDDEKGGDHKRCENDRNAPSPLHLTRLQPRHRRTQRANNKKRTDQHENDRQQRHHQPQSGDNEHHADHGRDRELEAHYPRWGT
jgi:hypothetical protein